MWNPRFLVLAMIGLVSAASSASAYTITVSSTLQEPQPPGAGCTITEAVQLVALSASAAGPGIRLGEPLLGNCTVEIGGDGITIVVPAGEYLLTTPYLNIDGQAGFPLIGPDSYPFIGVPWGIRLVGAHGGGTIIKRDPTAPAFRIFRVQTWLELEHLTLSGGDAGGDADGGGAIFGDDSQAASCPPEAAGPCRRPIILRHVTFDNNTAAVGGALASVYRLYGSGFTFTIEDSTFRSNHASYGGAIGVPLSGSASIKRSRFEDNVATQSGGALFSGAGESIEIEDTGFVRNRAMQQDGGAIHAPYARLTRGVLTENTAHNLGGAIYSYGGRPVVADTTFHRNSARAGGAISIVGGGSLEIRGSAFVNNAATQSDGGAVDLHAETGSNQLSNSTFSGNEAVQRGGAVSVYGGGLSINNVTFTGNKSGYGPGLALGWWGGSTVHISNSIAAGNLTTAGRAIDVEVDANEHLLSLGYNVIGTDVGTRGRFAGAGDQVGTEASPLDPGLLALADNGGPTQTHALAQDSRALDGGSTAAPGSEGACETHDQRGRTRPGIGSSRCDSGAFEFDEPPPTTRRLTVRLTSLANVLVRITTPSGIPAFTGVCWNAECQFDVPAGSGFWLKPQMESGIFFSHWIACPAVTGVECAGVLDDDLEVTAVLVSLPRLLTITVIGGGTVAMTASVGPGIAACTSAVSPCFHRVAADAEVILAATTPDDSLHLARWTGCDIGTTQTCTLKMAANRSVEAMFSTGPTRFPVARIARQSPGVVKATSALTAVSLSGVTSSDPYAGSLSYAWTTGAQMGSDVAFTPQLQPGTHLVTLVVTNSIGLWASTTATIRIKDVTAPVLTLPPATTVTITSGLSAPVPPGATAIDAVDGDVQVTCTPDPISLGTTTVRCRAEDLSGNTVRGTVTVTITFPLLEQQADQLLSATQALTGATAAMLNTVTRLRRNIAGGLDTRICANLADYVAAVGDSVRRGRISQTAGAALLAIANDMIALTGCGA